MKEYVLFQSGLYIQEDSLKECTLEADMLNAVLRQVEELFEASVLVGTVCRWNGAFPGYKYCHNFKGFQDAISGYDDITIKQIGTRLHFTLIHHDGRHEMELRRLSEYGYDNRDNVSFDYFNEVTMKFINRNTRNYGRLTDYIRYGKYLIERIGK